MRIQLGGRNGTTVLWRTFFLMVVAVKVAATSKGQEEEEEEINGGGTTGNRKRVLRSWGSVIYARPPGEDDEIIPPPEMPVALPLMVAKNGIPTNPYIECDDDGDCSRQLGEPCNEEENHPCDSEKGLVCRCKHEGDSEGVCIAKVSPGLPCVVHNKTYDHGETFTLDCRTQCACENGTYGCSSLCPQEHISPSRESCRHPRLVEVPDQCCREWMCDSQTAEQPPSCQPQFSRWSPCTSECGAGLSHRKSNLNNQKCIQDTETRICQIRRCQEPTFLEQPSSKNNNYKHHLRRGHECKATHRLGTGVRLTLGPCKSRKRLRPKYCGQCPVKGVQCVPTLSTTVKVDLVCDDPFPPSAAASAGGEENVITPPEAPEERRELLPEYLIPGDDLWRGEPDGNLMHGPPPVDATGSSRVLTVAVQWVLKCRCQPVGSEKSDKKGVLLHRVHRTAAVTSQP